MNSVPCIGIIAIFSQISSVFVRNYCIEGKSGGTITNAKEQESSDKDPETINFKQISTENIEVEKDLNETNFSID